MNTLSDYPWSNFLPEILALVPDVIVLQTLRNPVDWAKRRLQHHNPKVHLCCWLFNNVACCSTCFFTSHSFPTFHPPALPLTSLFSPISLLPSLPQICHINLHGSSKIRHPFDIIGCLGTVRPSMAYDLM